MTSLPAHDYQVLTALAARSEPVAIPDLAAELKLDQSQVAGVCLARTSEVEVHEEPRKELRLGKKGKEMLGKPFPERAIIQALDALGGKGELGAVATQSGLESKEVGQTLRWLKQKGWAEQQGKELLLTEGGKAALGTTGADEELVQKLASGDLEATEWASALQLLTGRTGVVEERDRVLRRARLTEAGRQLVQDGIQAVRQVSVLTSEMLMSGEWKDVELRPYDVTLDSTPVFPAKEHPLVSVFQQTRKVFLELGFEETVSPYVESSFWDFDALFQPQDHPARDMQDTFYIGRPAQCQLPDEDLVKRVGETHRNGGDTGSVGWRYDWDREITKRPVLRTHTTASTIRALAANPKGPRKVFCVGPVFRRETVDYKHLPVFHQVDGIIIDEHGSFACLLGTLKAFYRKMGFDRFQFRPAFFPYTEPSVEIFVWSHKKEDWVEMGGAGMFRPEVTRPLGCDLPVLAWGLGLERLAMFHYSLASIGELYRARIKWLKETPLCR